MLVAELTDVDFMPAMRRAAAIVTEQGGALSHAAIVARELGIPCVVGVTGARSRLVEGKPTTVDGDAGTVRQDDVLLGGHAVLDADLRSLVLYDRGLPMEVAEHAYYVEALPDGMVAFTADDLDGATRSAAEVELRGYFGREVEIIQDQKLLWYREWRRFSHLQAVTFFEARFRTALARWDSALLRETIDAVFQVAFESTAEKRQSRLHELYLRELGAALHALCGIAVEGIGAWEGFRETITWRRRSGVSFPRLLTADDAVADLPSGIRRIRECLEVLADLRNRSFDYFEKTGAFTDEYFGERAELVEEACEEVGTSFMDESSSLDEIYLLPAYLQFDQKWAARSVQAAP